MPDGNYEYHTAAGTRLSESRSNYSFCRPVRASAIISRFAYSSTLPAVIPLAKTGDFDRKFAQKIADIQRRAISLDGRIGRHDDFDKISGPDAFHQRVDGQLIRTDSVQRCDSPQQDVINALEDAGLFQAHQIAWLFHDAQPGRITRVGQHRSRRFRTRTN